MAAAESAVFLSLHERDAVLETIEHFFPPIVTETLKTRGLTESLGGLPESHAENFLLFYSALKPDDVPTDRGYPVSGTHERLRRAFWWLMDEIDSALAHERPRELINPALDARNACERVLEVDLSAEVT